MLKRETHMQNMNVIALAASNGEEFGNINHGRDFAKGVVDAMGVETPN